MNGKGKPIPVEMVLDDLTKTEMALPKTMMVRRLEIRIAEKTDGHPQKNAVGFAEVELRYEKKKRR